MTKHYDSLTGYYLSGTGNSFRAAEWLAEAAGAAGASAELVPITDARPKEDLKGGPRELVGIFHPTHGLMPPWSMIKFLLRLPWGRGAHAVVVATRGAFPLCRVVFPGGAGLALFFPLLVLLLKGYSVRGGMGIDMPVNMINIHWGLKPKNVDRVIAWGQRRQQRLTDAVLSGRRYWHPLNVLWELFWCLPFVLWPVWPIAYLLVGRVFMAKLMFSDATCRGCGTCARNCPRGAIVMVGQKPKTPFWTHRCEVCLRCMGYCRFHSVQASHLWIIPLAYGTSFITASAVQHLLATLVGGPVALWDAALEIIAILLTFLVLPLFYYVFWGLQRIKPFRTLFTYTTLTKLYPRRYHAPNTTSKALTRRGTAPWKS